MPSRWIALVLGSAALLFSQQWPNKEDHDHARDRERWFYDQRTWPNSSIPPGARRSAILQMRRNDAQARAQRQAARHAVSAAQAFAITTDSANWTSIGPRPTDPGASATSGRVNAIAIDPRDNNVAYIGAAEGGVWKTTDGGANWTPLTDGQASLAMGAIVLDPNNPDIVYAGTGEENFAQDAYYGAGILKSADGGATWTNIVGPFTRDYISALAVHPGDGQVLLAAAQTGIWRSADGGLTWSQALQFADSRVMLGKVPAISIFFDPNDGNVAWASMGSLFGNARNGVYRSTDAGRTWAPMTGGGSLSLPTADVGRIELTMAPSDSSTLYAQIQNSSTANFGALLGIWKTTDAGNTWSRLSLTASNWGAQLWFTNTIRVSPKDPNVVWSGALQIYRSLDGGATWTSLAQSGGNGTSIHVDFHALAFTPDGSRLYLANDGGMYSTTDISASRVNWTNLNNTLSVTQFYPGMALDASDAAIAQGGTQDNGSQRHDAEGRWSNVACGDGGYAAIDPAFPALAYAACQHISIQRNTGAAAWVPAQYGVAASDTAQFIAPLVLDPVNPQTLFFGTTRVWRSRDSGGRWTAISGDLTGSAGNGIKAIAVAPSDPNTVYIGTDRGVLQTTAGALAAGSVVWTNRSAGLPGRAITHISVDAVNPATAYATFSGFPTGTQAQGYIFKTTDNGATWTNIAGNLPAIPVNDLVIDPDVPDTLYAGTDIGVQRSSDGGATWSTLGNGLPNVVVHSLVLGRRQRVLRAGTHGRGVWEIALPLPAPSLAPAIDSISPTQVDTGGAGFSLSVAGSGFVPGTVIRWNGQDRDTHFVDAGHVTADIPAGDIAAPGRAAVTAFNASTGGGSSLPKGIVIGGAPASASNAFVSAAAPASGSALAPRSIASLYGTNLSSAVASADAGPPLPFTLADTTLTIGGLPAPLFFVSPGQINFQIPLCRGAGRPAAGGHPGRAEHNRHGADPAIFSRAVHGQRAGHRTGIHRNRRAPRTLAAPADQFPGARPAKPGEFLSIYCTGLGDVSNRPVLGAASPSSPLAATLAPPTVTIGGVNAPVQFSGLAPGFVGLYQVNVTVPGGVAPGSGVPLVLTIGGVPSNTATIALAPYAGRRAPATIVFK